MADSVSTEAWLDQRRWAALEEALKAQGSNVKRHLQDYLITLYNETVPLERWVQIETAITKEELESAQAAEDQKVYAAFHIRENGHDSIFSTGNGEEFLDVAIRLRRYLQGDAEAVKGGFSHHFYKTQPITRERFDELAALRLENTGKVSGAFEIDLDAGWCSALNLADGWQTFKNKDVSTAAYHANRTRNLQRNEQWRRLVDYLYGRNIELQTFGSIETRGIRPLREGDLTFSEEIILSGHGLNFQFDFTSDEAQREVLGPAADCLEPGGWLDILCNYDAARQEADATLSLTLHRQDGVVQKLFTYPLGKEERALLRKQMEADYLGRTGKTLNDYYAQLDMEREAPPELTAGTKRLPVDAVSFTDEITECDGKLNFYIPINFDPDAVFGTNVASAFNDDWLNVYANFGWKTGRIGKRGEAGVEYRKVYFRIRSRYQFDSGWPAETDAAKFHEESRSLFQSAGWDLQPGGDSTSDTVIKGQQELYLHPMNFSGIIEMDEIPAIQELLKDAKSFRCYGFDCYERYWELTDKEYLAQLETKREEITHEILERCRTKRKNLYITGPVALNVAQKFSVHRLCDKEGKHNLANRFVGELMEQLVQDGLLVTTKTRNGPGVRTATDAEISSPLPGQQQMTL